MKDGDQVIMTIGKLKSGKPRLLTVELYTTEGENGAGRNLVESKEQFAIFDQFPPILRAVLSELAYPYDCRQIRKFLDQQNRTEEQLEVFCDGLKWSDEQERAKEAYSMYGPAHPVARRYGRRKIYVHANSWWVSNFFPKDDAA